MRNARTILKILGWIWVFLVLPFVWVTIQVIEQLPRKGFPQNLYDITLGTLFLPGWSIILTFIVLGLLLLATIITGILALFGKQDEAANLTTTSSSSISGPIQIIHGDITNVTQNITYLVPSGSFDFINTIKTHEKDALIDRYTAVPFEAPPLPSQLIGRAPEIAALKSILFQQTPNLHIIGITGMGGIGKTVLATALAHDSQVAIVFPGGILWASVQANPDFKEILLHWIHVVNPSINVNHLQLDEWSILAIFFQMIQDRHMLLILDDVNEDSRWYIETLSRGIGQHSKVLITSRLVNLPGVESLVSLDVLPEPAAVALIEKELERHGRRINKEEQSVVREIAFLCGYFPLALRIVSAQINVSSMSIGEIRDRLRATQIGNRGTVGLDEVRKGGVRYTFDKVYDNLSVTDQSRFRALAVFPMPFEIEAAVAIWHVDTSEAKHTLTQFVQNSLLSLSNELYKMHPLLKAYASELFQNASQDEQKEVRKACDEYAMKRQGNS